MGIREAYRMYRTAIRLTIAENRADISLWSSKLLMAECKDHVELINDQIADMKIDNIKLGEILEV